MDRRTGGLRHKLGMCERTVTTHLNHIYRKLGANSRVSAIAAATRLGLIAPVPVQSELPLEPMVSVVGNPVVTIG